MGIIKAVGKLSAKLINRSYTNSQVRKAPSKAYEKTGKQMAAARKRGIYVDGSRLYQRNKTINIKTAKRRGKDREDFISDL